MKNSKNVCVLRLARVRVENGDRVVRVLSFNAFDNTLIF